MTSAPRRYLLRSFIGQARIVPSHAESWPGRVQSYAGPSTSLAAIPCTLPMAGCSVPLRSFKCSLPVTTIQTTTDALIPGESSTSATRPTPRPATAPSSARARCRARSTGVGPETARAQAELVFAELFQGGSPRFIPSEEIGVRRDLFFQFARVAPRPAFPTSPRRAGSSRDRYRARIPRASAEKHNFPSVPISDCRA